MSSRYVYRAGSAYRNEAVRAALTAYVDAIRDATVTRTGQDERRVRDCEATLHTAVYDYALASIPEASRR